VRNFCFAVGAFVASCLVLLEAALAAAPRSPAEDFVVGGGQTSGFVYRNIVVDAHSDPSGGNPSGNVSFLVETVGLTFRGPVTCLGITGNHALIGFDDPLLGAITVEVVDNGSTGSPPDTFFAIGVPTDCLSAPDNLVGGPLSGDLVVHDAPPLTSVDQCKHGGWRNYTDDQGRPFKNRGQCVRFVVHLFTPTSTSTTTTTTLLSACVGIGVGQPCSCGGHGICLYTGAVELTCVDQCVDPGFPGCAAGAPCPSGTLCAGIFPFPASFFCCVPVSCP